MNTSFGYRLFITIVIIAVSLGIIGGLILSGSPAKERLRTLDRRRSDQLSQLINGLDTYWNNKGILPTSLLALQQEPGYLSSDTFLDPVTQQPYPYRVMSSTTYELCAIFDTDTRADQNQPNSISAPDGPIYPSPHPAGPFCFTRTVTPWNRPK
jgi:hypothetical protein